MSSNKQQMIDLKNELIFCKSKLENSTPNSELLKLIEEWKYMKSKYKYEASCIMVDFVGNLEQLIGDSDE